MESAVNEGDEAPSEIPPGAPVILNKDGKPRKKRGRPPKNPAAAAAPEALQSFPSETRMSARRGRPPKNKDHQDEQQQQSGSKKPQADGDAFNEPPIGMGTMDFIRQQQEQAQALAQNYGSILASPVARTMIQAHALGQPMPEGIGLPLQGKLATAPGATTSAFKPTHAGTLTAMGTLKISANNAHHKNSGKTAVTTLTSTNQHPQQGTVAPHLDGTLPMSPRTMSVLLKGSTAVAEDMALSSLPLAAGGGVLTGTTITGPVDPATVQDSINNKAKKGTGMGRPSAKQQQGQSDETSQQQQPQKNNKSYKRKGSGARKGGGATTDPTDTRPRVTITDDDPQRLLNPLLDLPPPVLPAHHHNRHRSSIVSVGGEGSAAETPLRNIMQASELQAWPSIVFTRPDTYPIAQYARWLGFDVPPADEVKDVPEKNYLPPDSTEIPFDIARDDSLYHIPTAGQFAEQVWNATYSKYDDENGDAALEGCIDPLYKTLLAGSDDWTVAQGKPTSSKGPFKNPLSHQSTKFKASTPSPDRIQQVLQKAQDYGILKAERWSLAHVSRSNASATIAAGASTTDPSSGNPLPNAVPSAQPTGTSVLENIPGPKGPASAAAQSTATATTTEPSIGDAAAAIGTPATSEATKSSGMWGFAAWHKGRENDEPDLSMVLHYQFQWYYLTSSKDQKIAELVMRIPHGPMPTTLGSLNVASPPPGEHDYFADDVSSSAGSDWGVLSERRRLIILLYALVLEHARQCDVCYCLLQVPPSLVPLLQQFFRMTPVPLKKKKKLPTGPDGLTPTAAASTFVPMLCDLHKCSTKYALLLQKEILQDNTTSSQSTAKSIPPTIKHRILVRLPTASELNSAISDSQGLLPSNLQGPNGLAPGILPKPKRQRKVISENGSSKNGAMFCSAPGATRQAYLQLRANVDAERAATVPTDKSCVDGQESGRKDDVALAQLASSNEVGNAQTQGEDAGAAKTPASEVGGTDGEKDQDNLAASTDGTDATSKQGGETAKTATTTSLIPDSATKNSPVEQSETAKQVPVNGIRATMQREESANANVPEKIEGKPSAIPTNDSVAQLQPKVTSTVNAPATPETAASPEAFSIELEGRNREGKVTKTAAGALPAFSQPLSWDIVKSFPIVVKNAQGKPADAVVVSDPKGEQQTPPELESSPAISSSGVVRELKRLQEELTRHERECLEPKVRSLLWRVVEERRQFEKSDFSRRQAEERKVLETSEKLLARRKELDEAWQAQCDQDMDAVCEICNDGEVTPNNQILFCEACNVAVHQGCYGIERVPEGDYYCLACQHFGRRKVDRDVERRRLYRAAAVAEAAGETDIATIVQQVPQEKIFPAACELCPIRSGAFVPTDNYHRRNKIRLMKQNGGSTQANSGNNAPEEDKSTWAHMVCAKWQGLNFVENAKPDLLIEDVTELKAQYRSLGYTCCLCLGERGAFIECRFEGCTNRLHVMCARSSGLCDVVHGEDATETLKENAWSLLCPAHSNRPFLSPDKMPPNVVPVQKLVLMAKSFPPEPKPDPRLLYANKWPDNPFNKLTGQERREALANPKYEDHLMLELSKKLLGVRCEVCDQWEEDGKSLTRCRGCGVVFCDSCHVEGDGVLIEKRQQFRCAKCTWQAEKKKLKEEVEEPQCVVCNMKGGWLRPAVANPISRRDYWNKNHKKREKTLFRRPIWVHTLCAMWCAPAKIPIDADTGTADLSQLVMSDGRGFVRAKDACFLCGKARGLKEPCAEEECHYADAGNHKMPFFHPTCARQAGLEVKDDSSRDEIFYVKCYRHGGNEFNLRARIEDLLEIETKRAGKNFANQDAMMTFSDASRIFNASILVMRVLGWAWRWAEWWVEYGSNWEPLLEPGQDETKMTKKEKKIVDSTQGSRRDDARLCRLAAFGAALRNRAYDVEDNGDPDFMGGFDHRSLEQALRAVLNTPSLVGPLEDYEIDFLVDSLGRAYRSKSRLLGYGDLKVDLGKAGTFCFHKKDESPKGVLGDHPLPGKQLLRDGQVFEDKVDEVDDFEFYIDVVKQNEAEYKAKPKEPVKAKGPLKKKAAEAVKKRGPGRPPKAKPEVEPASPVKRGPGRPPSKNRQNGEPSTPKRGPGRPPKNRETPSAPESPSKPSTGRKRGRPPKNRAPEPEAASIEGVEQDADSRGVASPAPALANRTSLEPLRNRIERKRSKKRRRVSGGEESLETENDEKPAMEETPDDAAKETNATNGDTAAESESGTVGEAKIKEEPVAVVAPVKRGPGRPPKKKGPKPPAEPSTEPRPRKRRRVLGGGTSMSERPGPPVRVATAEPTVLYDTIKQRSRRKNQIMSLEQTSGKSYDTAEEASEINDDAADSSSDEDGDLPIAAMAKARKDSRPRQETVVGIKNENENGTTVVKTEEDNTKAQAPDATPTAGVDDDTPVPAVDTNVTSASNVPASEKPPTSADAGPTQESATAGADVPAPDASTATVSGSLEASKTDASGTKDPPSLEASTPTIDANGTKDPPSLEAPNTDANGTKDPPSLEDATTEAEVAAHDAKGTPSSAPDPPATGTINASASACTPAITAPGDTGVILANAEPSATSGSADETYIEQTSPQAKNMEPSGQQMNVKEESDGLANNNDSDQASAKAKKMEPSGQELNSKDASDGLASVAAAAEQENEMSTQSESRPAEPRAERPKDGEGRASRDPPVAEEDNTNGQPGFTQRSEHETVAVKTDAEEAEEKQQQPQSPVVKMEPDSARMDTSSDSKAEEEPEEPIEESMGSFDDFCQHTRNSTRKRARLYGKFIVAKHWPDKTK
ncbi:Protein Jade-1 [Seminavis robusta]|uniref:Protein Jade-1 n=1 Tax=Seminavis robusta TaxID=568900 RepID=A0A9N8E524_9STRA|nr:Protein Jade-1 [Seminavis robusta]|eukprot:Sro677_g185860.1 Protein Jade-1 (2782) ;mRNA; r:27380-35972